MPLWGDKEKRAEAKAAATAAKQAAASARRQRDENPEERWEYHVAYSRKGRTEGLFGSGSLELHLNRMGAAGWELVFMTPERIVFKRRIRELSAAEVTELAAVDPDEGTTAEGE